MKTAFTYETKEVAGYLESKGITVAATTERDDEFDGTIVLAEGYVTVGEDYLMLWRGDPESGNELLLGQFNKATDLFKAIKKMELVEAVRS